MSRASTHDWPRLLRLIPKYDPFACADGCTFDSAAADQAVGFFGDVLHHIEGAKAGDKFYLEDWQKAIIGNLFGWYQQDSQDRRVRRYRECLIYVPRKNGKTPLAAGIAAYVLFLDEEKGQQDYIAASTREQAGMLFRQLRGMVEREPMLAKRCRIYGGTAAAGQSKSIVKKPEYEGSSIKVISADGAAQHGQNPHLIIVDELHTQPNDVLISTLRTGMASANRLHPLTIYLTTADYDRESICNRVYQDAVKVRDGIYDDPAFLPAIWEATLDDDWRDEEVWARANPNLGVSVSNDYLRREVVKCKEDHSKLNEFLRLHLNVITKQKNRWLDTDKWKASAGCVDPAALEHCLCGGGLDLSAKYDLTAFVLCFTHKDHYTLLPRFWIPAETAKDAERKHGIPYSAWARGGHVTLLPGASIDYATIEAAVLDDCRRFQVEHIGFDPWNANATRSRLEVDGVSMVEFQQSLKNYNEPTKEFGRLVREGKLHHGGHPVLSWCAANVEVITDSSGNIRPVKPEDGSANKIDGVCAGIMALAQVMGCNDGSVYSHRGLLSVG